MVYKTKNNEKSKNKNPVLCNQTNKTTSETEKNKRET